MDMPRGAKPPKLRIASYSKDEINEWKSSIDIFEARQSEFMKDTLKGRPSKTGMTAGTGKEMYWVGLVPYIPDYSNCCRHFTSLGVEIDAGDNEEEDNNDNNEAD